MNYSIRFWLLIVLALGIGVQVCAQEWRSEPLSAIDQQYIANQREMVDDLARRHFGTGLNGDRQHDLAILQRLLDEGIVTGEQVSLLQGMGLILGELLKAGHGLRWVAYTDRLGRSRALQVPGFEEDFIFPATQISRRAEVGIKVDVAEVYRELEQAVEAIRKKPPF